MSEQFSRIELLYGEEAIRSLHSLRVAVFGVGGVGGYVCEGLIRSGIGAFDLIDNDTVALSNLNRQIIATHSSLDQKKVEVMKARMLDINPSVQVRTYDTFVLPENMDQFPFEEYDYIIDAIDTVSAKLALVVKARELQIPIISAMGAGNKLDPQRLQIADLADTTVCPLARVMRRELKKRGIEHLKVVYSDEKPVVQKLVRSDEETAAQKIACSGGETAVRPRRSTPGSTAFAPAIAGLLIASEVVKDLISS